MNTMNIIAIISLFIGIWFTFVNVTRVAYKITLPNINVLLMVLSWTVFISVMWVL